MIIISILATILIPVLNKRADQAKITTAKRDLEELANAEERVAIDIGYYVRMYALDDVAGGDGVGLGEATANTSDIDGIADEPRNRLYPAATDPLTGRASAPEAIFINPETQNFPALAVGQAFFQQYMVTSTAESSYRWQGPYFNIHRDETIETNDPVSIPRHMVDIPNDPWGNDYLFFTRNGLVLEPAGVIVNNASAQSVGYPATQVFDRPTMLSLGPDGIVGSEGAPGFGKGDDLYRSFGY